jgi:hypothetical protein
MVFFALIVYLRIIHVYSSRIKNFPVLTEALKLTKLRKHKNTKLGPEIAQWVIAL